MPKIYVGLTKIHIQIATNHAGIRKIHVRWPLLIYGWLSIGFVELSLAAFATSTLLIITMLQKIEGRSENFAQRLKL